MANKCRLWLTTIVLTTIVLYNSVHVEAGKKKDKGLIIVLSNGGCGGNIVVQTAKDGKKGGGHKIVVKGGDSGGGCGCSSSCGSCGGGHDHHVVQHVPIPVPVPPGHPIPPIGHPDMQAAMMSQLVPAFSSVDDQHQSSGSSSGDSSSDSGDQDTQASDSSSSSSSDDTAKESTGSSSDSSSSSSKAKMAPLFIPMNAITPPWFHGSPVFMDPSSQNHLSSTINNMPNRYSSSLSSSSSSSDSNYPSNPEKGEFAQSSNVAPTFNDPMFNLHGPGANFLPHQMGYHGFEGNPLLSQQSEEPKKDQSESNKSQGSRGGRNYLQPLIDSVQRLLRGPGPLREIEQGLVRQGQRMQASFSNLVPVAITNYTSYLPSLPGLRSSSGNRDRKPTTPSRRSRYLESLRIRLRPLTTMEGNRLTPFIENLWKNIRGRGSSSNSSPIASASETDQVKSSELNSNNLPELGGHHHHQHVLPIDPTNGQHPHHHFNIPGQQNNQVMQQYLEQILTSKWWEWPTGGLLGPNLNQY